MNLPVLPNLIESPLETDCFSNKITGLILDRWRQSGEKNPILIMPKKKREIPQSEQSERFRKTLRELEDAGELNRDEAAERFEKALQKIVPTKRSTTSGS